MIASPFQTFGYLWPFFALTKSTLFISNATPRSVMNSPTLPNYCRENYQMKGVANTVDMDQIKEAYYCSHPDLNKFSIVSRGPNFIKLLEEPYNRGWAFDNRNHELVCRKFKLVNNGVCSIYIVRVQLVLHGMKCWWLFPPKLKKRGNQTLGTTMGMILNFLSCKDGLD